MHRSIGRAAALAGALAAALAGDPLALAGEASSGCAGTLSGDVQKSFACTAILGTQAGGQLVFVVNAPEPIDGIPSLVPGSFLVPGTAEARTYTLDELGMGKAAVAVEGGALYTAAKTSSQRGEVTLTIRSIRKSQTIPGAYEVHGSYRARLLPAGTGRTGEVVVNARF